MAELTLTSEQEEAVQRVTDWLIDGETQTFTLAGYAGTGKTTIMQMILRHMPDWLQAMVVAPTGKAAYVLNTKSVPATTIHRFCYKAKGEDEDGNLLFEFDRGRVNRKSLVVIVDEASMVDQRIYNDLIGTNCRLLFVGDHGQLAPVGGDPGIMREPDFKLEKIMRQGEGSAIIQFAHHLREGGEPETFFDGAGISDDLSVQIVPQSEVTDPILREPDVWLVSDNETRCGINKMLRRGDQADSDKLVILRNNYENQLMNGQVFDAPVRERDRFGHPSLVELDGALAMLDRHGWLRPKVAMKDIDMHQIVADYGYALTVHKSQGSEWKHVAVQDRSWRGQDINRWRYTAVTRAKENLTWATVR